MHAASKAVIKPVYRYVHCDFQQNIALFCAISDFVELLLFANASCDFFVSNTVAIHKTVFFSGMGHWT